MPMYAYEYKVRRINFNFPLDMLRYDQSYPAQEQEIWMMSSDDSLFGNHEVAVRLIHLDSNRNWHPTYARWRSFGWEVVKENDPIRCS